MRNDSSPTIFWVLPDGSDEEQLIDPDPESFQIPSSWSADEQYLAFVKAGDTTQFDIWVLSMEGGRESRPFVNGPYNEKKPVFHPNGGWLAYVSDETGRFEVYVRQFPSGREKTLISTDGGNDPMWDPSGRTLYYRSGEKMMAIVIETEPYFTATQPKELFEGRYEMNEWGTSYDVVDTPDGLRFLMIKPGQEGSMVTQLNVVLNWSEELKRLAPMD
jgi:Tol biopolymer transport system component